MNQRSTIGGMGPGGVLPRAVKGLLIANGVLFLLQEVFSPSNIWGIFGLTPSEFWKGHFWQIGTYMFFHGSFMHLLFNMLAIWMFGSVLESVWGTNRFLKYYFLTGIGAGLCNCIFTPAAPVVIIGASGSVYGLLAAYGLMFPNAIVNLYMLFPIKAKYLVLIFGIFEFMSSLNVIGGGNSKIANLVHLGGMVIGVIYLKKTELLRTIARKVKGHKVQKRNEVQVRKTESEDNLQQEVDDLLDKINEVGIGNLTSWEKQRLRRASEQLKRRENH